MIKGKIIDIDNKTATVLTDDLAFLNIRPQPEMIIGHKFKFRESDVIRPKAKYFIFSAIAASFMLLISLALFFTNNPLKKEDAYAFVVIDINPSIELSIDSNNRVIGVKNINNDAQILTESLQLKGKTVKDALRDVLDRSKEYGFIKMESKNVILISISHNAGKVQKDKDKDPLGMVMPYIDETVTSLEVENIEAVVLKITPEQRKLSLENDISMGRYALYLKEAEKNTDFTLEDAREGDLNQILGGSGISNEQGGSLTNLPPHNTLVPTPKPEKTNPTEFIGKDPTAQPTGAEYDFTAQPTSTKNFAKPTPPFTNTPLPAITKATDSTTLAPTSTPTPKKTSTGYAWIDNENERIDKNRKRDVNITVVDSNNKIVRDARVEVKQISHGFPFGTAITRSGLNNPNYVNYVKKYFNWAVFENESKWYYNEPVMGNVFYDDADYMYNFCNENGIKVRGHCIFWEGRLYQPEWLERLDPISLRRAVDNRLNSVVGHFKGRFMHWDVNNEMIRGDFFKKRLGESIWIHMFKRAKEIDPSTKIFVNNNITTIREADEYKDMISRLLSQGVSIDGIGVHGHFDEIADRNVIRYILDKLSAFNIPIWITEYDSNTSDENKRADNL